MVILNHDEFANVYKMRSIVCVLASTLFFGHLYGDSWLSPHALLRTHRSRTQTRTLTTP